MCVFRLPDRTHGSHSFPSPEQEELARLDDTSPAPTQRLEPLLLFNLDNAPLVPPPTGALFAIEASQNRRTQRCTRRKTFRSPLDTLTLPFPPISSQLYVIPFYSAAPSSSATTFTFSPPIILSYNVMRRLVHPCERNLPYVIHTYDIYLFLGR